MSISPDYDLFSFIPDELKKPILYQALKQDGNLAWRTVCKDWTRFELIDPILTQCWNDFKNVSIRAQLIEDKNVQNKQPQNNKERFRELHQCFKKEFSLGSSPIAPIVVPDQYFAYENESLMTIWNDAIWPQISLYVHQLDDVNEVREYLRSTDVNILKILEDICTLDARNLNIKCIPEEIRFLPNLNMLILSGNNLTELPAFLGNLRNVQHLWVSQNSLQKFPDNFHTWTHLLELDVNDNPLSIEVYAQLDKWSKECHMCTPKDLWYVNEQNYRMIYS